MIFRLATPLVLVALAAAQSPFPGKTAAPTVPAVALQPSTEPRFDRAEDGTLWAAGATYKAQFRPQGVQFLPFFGSDLPANVTLDLELESVRLAGQPLSLVDAMPERRHSTIDYDRGAVLESYQVTGTGLEQTFTFAQLPQRGELAFAIRAGTSLRGESSADGLLFAHERGAVHYTTAVAIDALGRRLSLPTTLDGDRIHFTVPASFVAEAALPLVVDPVVTPTYYGPTFTYQITGKDLAYDASANEWQVVWSYQFSLTDSDLLAQRFDDNWTALASSFAIDLSVDSWTMPSIANLALYDKFLTVARKVTSGTSRIAGRITATGSNTPLSAQFEIEGPGATGNLGRPATSPDVGGDSSSAAPTYWTVAFEVDNGSDTDVYARQVTEAGVLRGSAPIAIANTAVPESAPRISKSSGRGSFSSQAWGIAYNCNVWQIHGRSVTWNGGLVGPSQVLFSGVNLQSRFDISSPTDDQNGQRQMLLTFEYVVNQQSSMDICGVLVDRTMTTLANPVSLTALALNPVENLRAQIQPSVDCDGRRFVVAFAHDFGAPDFDIYAAVFHQTPGVNGLLRCVQVDAPASWFDPENEPKVCAQASGGGARVAYGMIWTHAMGPTTDRLEGCGYDGRQEGSQVTVRPTACGNLVIGHSGSSLAGDALTLTINNGNGLVGMVVGFPTSAPVPGCAGCVQGVQGNALLVGGYVMNMPVNGAYIGMTVSFQGFAFGSGPCLGQVSLTDTVDATIR